MPDCGRRHRRLGRARGWPAAEPYPGRDQVSRDHPTPFRRARGSGRMHQAQRGDRAGAVLGPVPAHRRSGSDRGHPGGERPRRDRAHRRNQLASDRQPPGAEDPARGGRRLDRALPRRGRRSRLMPARLSTREPGFAAAFAQLVAAKREVAADVDAAVAAIIEDVVAPRRRRPCRLHAPLRSDRACRRRTAPVAARNRRGCGCRPGRDGGGLAIRRRADRELSPPSNAGRDRLCRCAGGAPRRPLGPGRRRRALCAGWHRFLSLLGADERDPGRRWPASSAW